MDADGADTGPFARPPGPPDWLEARIGVRMSSHWCGAKDMVQKWWGLTTGAQFLSSTVSRRGSRFIWLLWAFFGYFCDRQDAPTESRFSKSIIMFDALLIIVVLGTLRMPRASMLADVAFVFAEIILWIHGLSSSKFLASHFASVQFLPFQLLGWTIMMSWTGVHPCLVSLYAAVTYAMLMFYDLCSVYIVVICGVCTFISVWSSAFVDFRIAQLLFELEAQRSATEHLLDHASDGFCTVNIKSGAITSASSKLEDTLHADQLEGMSFGQFIQPNDITVLENLYASVETNRKLTPVMLTCRTLEYAVPSLAFRQFVYFLHVLASTPELGPQNLSPGRKFYVESDFQSKNSQFQRPEAKD